MREHLYKAKRLDNGEWVEGSCVNVSNIHFYIFTGKLDIRNGYLDFEKYSVNPETVCQFTGLYDKNGNKIWENDIVRCYKYISGYDFVWNEKVQYKNGHFRSKSVANLGFCSKRQNILVIGNIFDNPELLKGGAE